MNKYKLVGWIDGQLTVEPNWDKWFPVNFPVIVEADVEYQHEWDNLVTVDFMNNREPMTFKLGMFKYEKC